MIIADLLLSYFFIFPGLVIRRGSASRGSGFPERFDKSPPVTDAKLGVILPFLCGNFF